MGSLQRTARFALNECPLSIDEFFKQFHEFSMPRLHKFDQNFFCRAASFALDECPFARLDATGESTHFDHFCTFSSSFWTPVYGTDTLNSDHHLIFSSLRSNKCYIFSNSRTNIYTSISSSTWYSPQMVPLFPREDLGQPHRGPHIHTALLELGQHRRKGHSRHVPGQELRPV